MVALSIAGDRPSPSRRFRTMEYDMVEIVLKLLDNLLGSKLGISIVWYLSIDLRELDSHVAHRSAIPCHRA